MPALAYKAPRARTFRTVRHALLWYRDQLARRLQATRQGFDAGPGPCSAEQREQVQATFAVIAQCLRAQHPGDPRDDDGETTAAARGECVAWLLASYEARWGDNTWLADRAGFSRWAFTRRCKRTERALRARMEWAGVLDVD